MAPDRQWKLIDTVTNRAVRTIEEREFIIIPRLPGSRCATCKVGFGLKEPDSRLGGWFGVVDRHRWVRLNTEYGD